MPDNHACCEVDDAPVAAATAASGAEAADPAPAAPGPRPATSGAGAYAIAPRVPFAARLAAFLAIGLLILGLAVWLVRPMDQGAAPADYTVQMNMSGFVPGTLHIPVGQPVTVRLVNDESPYHASGALHQFAVDALGIDVQLDTKQSRVITLQSDQPGTYTYYCDVCCGGKKSPTMQGTLTFY